MIGWIWAKTIEEKDVLEGLGITVDVVQAGNIVGKTPFGFVFGVSDVNQAASEFLKAHIGRFYFELTYVQ